MKDKIENDDVYALEYLEKERGLKNPRICLKKIKTDMLFEVDGFKMWLSGRTGEQLIFKGANQLILSSEETQILKKVLKYVQRYGENKNLKLTAWDELSNIELLELYDVFLNKIRNTIYGIRLSAQIDTLMKKREKFASLSNEEKCIVLSEILHMFQCNSSLANLKLIGGPESAGNLRINKNITKCEKIMLIHQSPTGIYEQKVDLKRV